MARLSGELTVAKGPSGAPVGEYRWILPHQKLASSSSPAGASWAWQMRGFPRSDEARRKTLQEWCRGSVVGSGGDARKNWWSGPPPGLRPFDVRGSGAPGAGAPGYRTTGLRP